VVNHFTMANTQPILTLHQRGWSNRSIAEALGVHRKAVGRNVKQTQASQAEVPTNLPPSPGRRRTVALPRRSALNSEGHATRAPPPTPT